MMKKALWILAVLAALAATAFGAYTLGTNQNEGNQEEVTQESTTQNITNQNGADKTAEVPGDDGPPPYDEMIVGVWQNSPAVGAGIGECYRFYADGTYAFIPGAVVLDLEEYRPPRSEGTYTADQDGVTLRMVRKIIVEGGEWVENPILGYVLEGGTEKTVEMSKTIFTIYLGKFKELDRHMLDIGGRTYWKLSGDPEAYLD